MDEKRIIRAPSLKRGKNEERITNRIKLEKVLGVTVSSNAALASDTEGTIAYPAGCTVVLFNTKTERQHHIINTSRKTITSLAFSSCGRYIVTGECGHQPAVRVWDLYSDPLSTQPGLAAQPQQISEFFGHKYGVNCVAFSPSGKYVVSVGTQHDMIVNVWDWKNNIKVASNKVSTKVKAVAFADNGSYFVTVGNRHVKFWYLEYGKSKYKEAVPLMGRSAILGEQRNNYFCDVACGKAQCGDSTYAITRSGLLCEFNNRRLLDKWVELRTTSANCITVGEKYIFVGCAEGIIRCFDPASLRFITTLPRTHYLGVDVSLGTSIAHMASPPADAKYPDTVAITYNETTHKLTSVYNDHSVYVWDVFNIKRVGKSFSFLYHSACIWGVEMAPPNSPLPPGSFLTCSSDDTIRVWTLDKLNESSARGYRQNVYSNELLKVVYVDKDLSYIKDLDLSTGNASEKSQETSYDGRNGVRCIRVSPDGKNLASGDRSGNIRVYDTSSMREMFKIEGHDAEVLCLEYCGGESGASLMASASRDRLLHVFDVNRNYDFLQTLDDHSSSITAVRFLTHHGNIQMVSCGADKSLIFRSLAEAGGKPQFSRDHHATGKTTLYDMEVDTGQKHVITACQDRNVRIYSVNTGKYSKSFKGSTGDDGTLIKVVLDRSGIYLATSCTDKSLSVYDYYSGECMATMCGHSELATGLRFTNDCRRLISASGDGCIFVWRVPHDMVVTMHARLSQQAMRQGKTLDAEVLSDGNMDMYETDASYRFSIGQLPQWAKRQFTEESGQPPSLSKGVAAPKGRWAQRAETSMSGKGGFYSAAPLPFQPPPHDRRFDSDGSKDSSLEEGRKDTIISKEIISSHSVSSIRSESRRDILSDNLTDTGFESTAHDGDIDSDNEYRHRPLYYPTQAESPTSGSEFTITNIDVEELRKSQRKKKGSTPQILIQQASAPYGSQDSEDDEDEASTPSGDNTDRNPMSLFSVSSESLDQLVSREKYLQATFESMSGAETEMTPSKTSISSKFLTKSSNINMAAINAVKQTKSDPEALKKRQLLSKRIAETKKKLESVGHSSPLKYSQSIHDLSRDIPERDKWSKKQQSSGGNSSSMLPHNHHHHHSHTSKYIKLHQSLPVSPVSEECSFTDYVAQEGARKSFSCYEDAQQEDDRDYIDANFKQVCSDIAKFAARMDDDGSFSSDSLEDPNSFRSVGCKPVHRSAVVAPPRRCVSNHELRKYNTETENEEDICRSESFYLNPGINNSQDSILSDDQLEYDQYTKSNSMESILSNDSDCKSAPLEALFAHKKRSMVQESRSVPHNLASGSSTIEVKRQLKTSQTQTDFDTPHDIVTKKFNSTSAEFQEKLLRFETNIAKKPVAFFVNAQNEASKVTKTSKESKEKSRSATMYIPSLDTKNRQYNSMFCNVLNNKPEVNRFQGNAGCNNSTTISSTNSNSLKFEKNTNRQQHFQETSSLDRHLFAKNLLVGGEKICHKPPKAVRRHSSKTRKKITYEYVKKEDLYNNKKKSNEELSSTIELSYKEKNAEKELENTPDPHILNELYDSLDKASTGSTFDHDSLSVNLRGENENEAKPFDSLEIESVNVWSQMRSDQPKFEKVCRKTQRIEEDDRSECKDSIQFALENIKILNEIQRKICKINALVDVFKKNVYGGKVRALSSMYENLTQSQSYYNDLTKLQATPVTKFRRRNLSLPSFVERRLNAVNVINIDDINSLKNAQNVSAEAPYVDHGSPNSSLRRSCSLSDLSMQKPTAPKNKIEQVSGRKTHTGSGGGAGRVTSRYIKNNALLNRSRSNDVLNQSDSENEADKKVSRLMRPTISSHNKINNKNLLTRKKQSYSTSNLNTVGVDNVSTSDDEIEPVTKPAVPPRNRNTYDNVAPAVTPRRHLNNKDKTKVSKHFERIKPDLDTTLTNNHDDLSTVEISHQLCDDVIGELTRAADNVVELYNRLSLEPEDIEARDPNLLERTDMAKHLEMSILQTHKVLHDCIFKKLRNQSNGNQVDVNQTDTVKKLNDLVSRGPSSGSVVNIMEQYSDILLEMVQQKIHSSNI